MKEQDLKVIIRAQESLSQIYFPLNQEIFDDIVEAMVAVEEPTVEAIIEKYEDALPCVW